MKYNFGELDALMAEAMGWTRTNDREGAVWIDERGHYTVSVGAWKPSLKLDQAWNVLHKVSTEREWRFNIGYAPHWGRTTVTATGIYGNKVNTWAEEETPSLAITIAILYALRMYGDFDTGCDNGCGNPDDLPLRLNARGYQICADCRKVRT